MAPDASTTLQACVSPPTPRPTSLPPISLPALPPPHSPRPPTATTGETTPAPRSLYQSLASLVGFLGPAPPPSLTPSPLGGGSGGGGAFDASVAADDTSTRPASIDAGPSPRQRDKLASAPVLVTSTSTTTATSTAATATATGASAGPPSPASSAGGSTESWGASTAVGGDGGDPDALHDTAKAATATADADDDPTPPPPPGAATSTTAAADTSVSVLGLLSGLLWGGGGGAGGGGGLDRGDGDAAAPVALCDARPTGSLFWGSVLLGRTQSAEFAEVDGGADRAGGAGDEGVGGSEGGGGWAHSVDGDNNEEGDGWAPSSHDDDDANHHPATETTAPSTDVEPLRTTSTPPGSFLQFGRLSESIAAVAAAAVPAQLASLAPLAPPTLSFLASLPSPVPLLRSLSGSVYGLPQQQQQQQQQPTLQIDVPPKDLVGEVLPVVATTPAPPPPPQPPTAFAHSVPPSAAVQPEHVIVLNAAAAAAAATRPHHHSQACRRSSAPPAPSWHHDHFDSDSNSDDDGGAILRRHAWRAGVLPRRRQTAGAASMAPFALDPAPAGSVVDQRRADHILADLGVLPPPAASAAPDGGGVVAAAAAAAGRVGAVAAGWAAGGAVWAATRAARGVAWAGDRLVAPAVGVAAGRGDALYVARDAVAGAAGHALGWAAGVGPARGSSWWEEAAEAAGRRHAAAAVEAADSSAGAGAGAVQEDVPRPASGGGLIGGVGAGLRGAARFAKACATMALRPVATAREAREQLAGKVGDLLRPVFKGASADSFQRFNVLPVAAKDDVDDDRTATRPRPFNLFENRQERLEAEQDASRGLRSPPSFSFGSSRMGAFGVAAGDSALAQAFRLDLFYCIGAAEAVLDEFTDRVVAGSRYLGCGAGALVAAVMALGLGKTGLDRLMDAAAQWESESRSTLLGPLTTTAAFLRAQLDEVLPITTPDLTGRLFVSVTRFPSMENELLTKLPNKQCIIDAIMASCYQPVIHESPIRLEESVRHMDTHAVAGSYSNRLPQYDGRTITVSRVPGEANASPSLDRAQRVTPKADGPESATEFARRQGDADGRTYLEGLKASGSITLCAFKGF